MKAKNNSFKEKYFIGYQIKASQQLIRCIDSENINHGVISFSKAMSMANDSGLDLVQIAPGKDGIPTCKIINFSKFKYEQDKKNKLAKRKQRENSLKIKEIKFRPSTGLNDLKIKAKHAQNFINNGCKLKITLTFKGRELAYKEVANDTMNTFMDLLYNVQYEMEPSVSGKSLTAMVVKVPELNI